MNRILLVTTIFPPQIGGPATFINRLAHALADAGERVTVVCATPNPDREQDASLPFRVVRVGGRSQVELEIRARLALIWQMLRHDAVLVNGLEYPAFHAATVARKTYIAKIVGDTVWETARNNGLTPLGVDAFQSAPLGNAYLQRLSSWRSRFLSRARLVITPSQYLRQLVVGWGVPEDRMRVIPNGVPLKVYADVQPARRAPAENLKVVFVGRLTNWKGVETLLLAASAVDGIECHIIGDGPSFPLLHTLAKQLGLKEKVKFLGRLDPQATRRTMSAMHVLVLGSAYEGLSHTLLEASAQGLAIIASNCGGNPEVIEDGRSGLLFPYGDVSALARALQALRDDEAFRYRLALGAKQNSLRFNFDTTVEMTRQLLIE